jgi:hypothetical protein
MRAPTDSAQSRPGIPQPIVGAQRVRVSQRKGDYRPGLRVDRDHWDRKAPYFFALLWGEQDGGVLLGTSRLIIGGSVPGFRFLTEENFELELPPVFPETALPALFS